MLLRTLGASILFAASSWAAIVADVAPLNGGPCTGLVCISAVSWTTTDTYYNVQISAWLAASQPGEALNAYLVNQIGPGTTEAANEIASVSLNPILAPYPDFAQLQLFSLPILTPGTYFMVLYAPNDNLSYVAQGGTATTAPGVTVNSSYLYVGSIEPYPPATDFVENASLAFRVTGDLTQTQVPEPSTMILGVAGHAILAIARRQAKGRLPRAGA